MEISVIKLFAAQVNDTYERYNVVASQMEMQKNHHGDEMSDMECAAGGINPAVYCLRCTQVLTKRVGTWRDFECQQSRCGCQLLTE